MEEKKKFCRIDKHLRLAVGLEFQNDSLPLVNDEMKGIAEVRPTFGKEITKVYLDLVGAESDPKQFQVTVPEAIKDAPWGEILLNNNKPGVSVLFGRKEEDMPFGFPEKKYFITLRVYPQEKAPTLDWKFNPVYVRVDEGTKTYFFVIKAEWKENVITVEINHNPSDDDIPYFL